MQGRLALTSGGVALSNGQLIWVALYAVNPFSVD